MRQLTHSDGSCDDVDEGIPVARQLVGDLGSRPLMEGEVAYRGERLERRLYALKLPRQHCEESNLLYYIVPPLFLLLFKFFYSYNNYRQQDFTWFKFLLLQGKLLQSCCHGLETER